MEAGASAQKISAATRTLTRAEKGLEAARTSVNKLARQSGNALEEVSEAAAKAATRTTEDVAGLRGALARGWERGTYQGWRIGDPTRSPIAEGLGVTASFGMGVVAERQALGAQVTTGNEITGGTMKQQADALENLFKDDTGAGEETSPPPLRDNFQQGGGTNNGQLDLDSSSSLNINSPNHTFNNRAGEHPITIPLDGVVIRPENTLDSTELNALMNALDQK